MELIGKKYITQKADVSEEQRIFARKMIVNSDEEAALWRKNATQADKDAHDEAMKRIIELQLNNNGIIL